MSWSLPILRIAGTQLRIHVTFLLLIGWLAFGYYAEGGSAAAAGRGFFFLLFFVWVVLHEFGHAFAAKAFGINTPDITLLPIGGVVRLERMPEEPTQELIIAVAGPAVNVIIALCLFLVIGGHEVFNPATDRPVANLGFLSLGSPSTLAVGDGFVWVGFGDGTLIRLDPGSRTRVGDVSVGGSIDGIAIDRSAVWTMDRLHNTISRIDPHSSKVTLTAQVGGNLKGIAVGSGSVWVSESTPSCFSCSSRRARSARAARSS